MKFNLQTVPYTPINPLGFNFLYPMKELLGIYETLLRRSVLFCSSSVYKSKAHYTPRLAAMDSTPLLTHWRFKNTLFIKVKHTKLKLTHTLKTVFFQ